MFIYNFKINSSKLFKIIFFLLIIFIISLCIIIGFKLFNSISETDDSYSKNNISKITNTNYSNVLKTVHEDIDSYIGTKISFSGFVYRVYDLNKEQFVLGRNMIISSDLQTVVVGFLCSYKDALIYKDQTWVEIEGTIEKGIYHNEPMPIIKITSIKQIDKPNDEFVYPPDENYVPTINLL